jgi:hypothetical protein
LKNSLFLLDTDANTSEIEHSSILQATVAQHCKLHIRATGHDWRLKEE